MNVEARGLCCGVARNSVQDSTRHSQLAAQHTMEDGRSATQQLWKAVAGADGEGVRAAVAAGGDANAKDCAGTPALVAACLSAAPAAAAALLACGAEVNVADAEGRTPLLAACGAEPMQGVVLPLVKAGAAVNAADVRGRLGVSVGVGRGMPGLAGGGS